MSDRVAQRVRAAHWVWGVLLLVAAVLLGLDVLPGAGAFRPGPRIGMVAALATLGALVIGVPLSTWVIRKTTRPEDYQGGCPVGRLCPACDAFNFNPRNTCRDCGASLEGVGPAQGPRPGKREPI